MHQCREESIRLRLNTGRRPRCRPGGARGVFLELCHRLDSCSTTSKLECKLADNDDLGGRPLAGAYSESAGRRYKSDHLIGYQKKVFSIMLTKIPRCFFGIRINCRRNVPLHQNRKRRDFTRNFVSYDFSAPSLFLFDRCCTFHDNVRRDAGH